MGSTSREVWRFLTKAGTVTASTQARIEPPAVSSRGVRTRTRAIYYGVGKTVAEPALISVFRRLPAERASGGGRLVLGRVASHPRAAERQDLSHVTHLGGAGGREREQRRRQTFDRHCALPELCHGGSAVVDGAELRTRGIDLPRWLP